MTIKPNRLERRDFIKRAATFVALAGHATEADAFAVRQAATTNPDPALLRKWAATLRGRVILPDDAAYDASRRVWNLAFDRRPAAVVQCADSTDVVRSIEFARRRSLPLAVRSGGHSQAGFSTCDGGLIVDLGQLKSITVDATGQIARAEVGTRVGELLKGLHAHSVVTPTGGCPDVAIGGLTLGGGENALMAKYGAVCDNVIAADVVTADGRTLRASLDENVDLFWALRGGGGNFGVVTAFEYRVYPAPVLIAGSMFFALSGASDALKRYRDLMERAPDELETSGGLIPGAKGPVFFIFFAYCGETSAGEQLADQWRSILKPTGDVIRRTPYAATFLAPPVASVGTGAFLPNLDDEVVAILAKQFIAAPPGSTAMWNDYHGVVTRVRVEDMAFPLRKRGYDLFLSATWQDPAQRSVAAGWVEDTRNALAPHTRGLYVNNLGTEAADRIRDVYGANYPRLAALKTKFDPTNVFRLNANIEPARV